MDTTIQAVYNELKAELGYTDEPFYETSDLRAISIAKDFNCSNSSELEEKIKAAHDFNDHAIGRVIIYPTQDINELESLYFKYMALDIDSRSASDSKAREMFGKPNRDIYAFIKDNIIKTKNDEIKGEYSPDTKESETNSLFTNDLPLITPEELVQKVHEDYSCFTESEAESIKRWRQEYALLGMGIKTENYNKYNLERINILRKAIYNNNEEAIIQCGWVPGVEFDSDNRVKASQIVKEKMEVSDIFDFDMIEEAYVAIEKDFKKKGNKSLSSFKRVEISKQVLNDYKKDFKALSHIRENCKGYLYLDNNKCVAVVAVEDKGDYNFIQAIEVAKDYQGYGLSKQLLDIATKKLNAKNLSVNKKNKLAIDIYKKYGFKIYDETESMWFMINESYIEENIILNKKDLEINLDKFENGEKNVLLVTGFSGSGKSTLARQLSSKYKCAHYELDCLDFYLSGNMSIKDATGNEDGLVAFINKKNLKPDKNLNNNEIKKLYKEYIKFLINWCKKQKGKFIIEGLQIYEVYEDGDTFITSCPIVIKGTGGLVSAIRAAKRNNSERDDSTFLKEFKPLITWALKDSKSLNKLEKSLNESYIEEASNNEDKKAVSIILVSGSSLLAKTIKKVQGTQFSHASISLDDDISRIYSYNMRNGFNGFTYESIKNYIKEGVDRVGVYTFLVSDKVYKSIENVLNNFSLYIKDTKYSILNLLTIPLNIPLDMNMKMVCSEFVDTLLKAAHIDLTNKKSSLVSPKDFINATKTNTKIVEVYNGHPKNFNHKEVEKKIKNLKKSRLPVVEFVEYDNIITEAKSFPVQFDSDGNLILKNIRSINFEQEYANSHRLLKEYEKTKSYEPMKFELAKMQFFITLLEKKIYKYGKDKTSDELKVRARFLNDFKKYLKIVTTNDPSFNFTEYYEQSPFNDALIKIDKSTLKFGFEALKYLIK